MFNLCNSTKFLLWLFNNPPKETASSMLQFVMHDMTTEVNLNLVQCPFKRYTEKT